MISVGSDVANVMVTTLQQPMAVILFDVFTSRSRPDVHRPWPQRTWFTMILHSIVSVKQNTKSGCHYITIGRVVYQCKLFCNVIFYLKRFLVKEQQTLIYEFNGKPMCTYQPPPPPQPPPQRYDPQ